MNILKQLTVWGTALRHKVENDIFSPIKIKIALCLALFVGVVITGFVLVLIHVKKVLMGGMIDSLTAILATGTPDPSILTAANNEAESIMYGVVILIVLCGLFAGLLLTRLSLAPMAQVFTMQRRFISGIAHELRTPLSIVRVNNELALLGEADESPYASVFSENISDIDKITEILNNLLMFERMTTTTKMRFDEIDLHTLLEQVITRLTTLAKQKQVLVTCDEISFPRVIGNATALEQVFFNILKNAIHYTKSGGQVTVRQRDSAAGTVAISITDTGIGIREKDLPRIFEPFYRSETVGKLSGTGIGLAIVYEIVKIHNGTIEVESIEGEGTTFVVSLPTASEQTHTYTHSSKVSFDFKDTKKS